MKSKEVLELLQISRPTLTKYVRAGLVKTVTLPNGRYDYSKESVSIKERISLICWKMC